MTTTRRIVANFFISLDGVVESPDKWHFPYFNEEMMAAIGAGFEASDALLMGGTTYREWADYWPTSEDQPIAGLMNGITKYVVSNSLDRADWQNTTLVTGPDVADQIRAIKSLPGKDIAMSGSGTLVNWLLSQGLLDELHLMQHPVVVGAGRKLFDSGATQRPMELVSSTTFTTGVLDLVYRPAK
jgi:dihydrofolate reductase